MTLARNDATQAQVDAARPNVSIWLSANAGSGKTRVLTDRVARLLLEQVDPQKILCLTYTKAAASEMQNRLFKRLGAWAMLGDAELRTQLQDLGYGQDISGLELAQARTLFARAIETPGGLKIQTIHAFCSSVLRRFPLEAGVSPDFSEMEDRAAELLRIAIVDDMAMGEDAQLVTNMAAIFTGAEFHELTQKIVSNTDDFTIPFDRARAANDMGFDENLSAQTVLDVAFDGTEELVVRRLARDLEAFANKTNDALVEALSCLNLAAPGESELAFCQDLFLYRKEGQLQPSAKTKSIPTKAARENLGAQLDSFHDFMTRIAQARDAELALAALEKAETLHAFASVFLQRYAEAKQQRGWLDFDDLIRKTRNLLSDKSVAAWVLYRLDGGIDHILIDEAQDTSPSQWAVIEALADEIISGDGSRAGDARTLFVVGDKKQSIYSFQGADANEFDRMHSFFSDRLAGADRSLASRALQYSFRSSATILDLVDATFDGLGDAGFVADHAHIAFKTDLPGRVDLWPLVEDAASSEDGPWHEPLDRKSETHHNAVLAKHVADQVERLLNAHEPTLIPDEEKGSNKAIMRPVQPKDIMILVQRRSGGPFNTIIQSLKRRGLPVAGADRLKVGAELAVKDILALLSFLVTSDDSLSLASVLRSPLFGWSERDLFQLAHYRKPAALWEALRKREDLYPETIAILTDLRKLTDVLRPFELIERVLTRHQGRAKLIGRIGQDAEDGIDALLAQALAYERVEIPSLTGFLSWAKADALEIKRQVDSSNNLIRVMTVHGSKGLESPIVILPDCAARQSRDTGPLVTVGEQILWKSAGSAQPTAVTASIADRKAAAERENLRLLYVAMTRSEKWLITAAAGKLSSDGSDWYSRVKIGMERQGAGEFDFASGSGLRLQSGDWTATTIQEKNDPKLEVLPIPALFREPPPSPVRPVQPRSPSQFGGPKALPSEQGLDEETAKARGTYVHSLMEVLPGKPRNTWRDVMNDLAPHGLAADLIASSQSEATAALEATDLAWIFGPDSLPEVAVQGEIDGHSYSGIIDRLVVKKERVVIVDFKTNVAVPDRAEQCPSGILAQMGAYLMLVESLYPDTQVNVGVLWTATGEYMSFAHNMVRQALIEAPYLDGERAAP